MKKRDKAKHNASILAKAGENATTAWAEYRKIRNKINNRLRFEERTYKQKRVDESLDSPAQCWSTAKTIMNWT